MVGLSTLSTEHEIVLNIDLKELVSTFGKLKGWKIKFYIIMCISFSRPTYFM
jgi:hypothetical protein